MRRMKWALAMLLCMAFAWLGGFRAQAQEAAGDVTQEIGQNLTLDPAKYYIFYSAYNENQEPRTARELTIWDYKGASEGWLRSNTYANSDAYKWSMIATETEGAYIMKNVASNRQVKAESKSISNSDKEYAVSHLNTSTAGGAYRFIIKEKKDGKYYVLIQSVTSNKYMMPDTSDATNHHIIFTDQDTKSAYWCVEEKTDGKLPGAKILWDTITVENGVNIYYRIPAITTANDGRIVAVTDKRYRNNSDLGNHQIDLLFRSSEDNGQNWGASQNMTQGLSTATTGFGDAAIVADRESDKVLVICVGGSAGYFGSNPSNRITVNTFLSEDGGQNFAPPRDITDQIYGLDDRWLGLFAGSGRMMQSRYIKVGDYYRIYTAISCRAVNWNGSVNHVLYSDDFGENWHILGNTTMETAPVAPGDEPKVEELPNGDVVIASRKLQGRYVNIFSYDKGDATYTNGSWASQDTLTLGECGGCDGETYFVYAKKKDTGEYVYLALQSIPTLPDRHGVGIYYKELGESDTTPQAYIQGWGEDKFFMVQEDLSAYSTFSIQKDGKLAFFYEDGNPAYDMVYVPIGLDEITEGAYEMAFTGIGSKDTPYEVTTQEQVEAVTDLYVREGVSWRFSEACIPWLKTALNTKAQEAQDVYNGGSLAAERPAAAALNEKIGQARTLSGDDNATADQLFACCQELAAAVDEYQGVGELDGALSAKLQEAETMYASNQLAEGRQAARDLKAAIDRAEAERAAAAYGEIYVMIAALTESMEEYEAVAGMTEGLEEKISAAEALLATNKLDAERMEVSLLQAAIAAAEEKAAAGTSAELQAALEELTERMEAYDRAEAQVFTVEARYSSVNIRLHALSGVTSYKIYRSAEEDGEYRQIGTVTIEEGKAAYSYIDTGAGTGTRYWYLAEAVKEGAENIVLGPIRDVYATGIEAVQKNAETGQYHKDFVAGGDTQFGGSRMHEATAAELARVAGLYEGTLLISYKPANVSGKKAIFAVKQESASVGSADLATNTGLVFYQNNAAVRLDCAGPLKGNWSDAAPAGQWSTFGYVNTNYDGTNNNILTSRNGTSALSYGRSDMNGFIGKSQNLTSMTIGAGKNGNAAAAQFSGEIAYVTVTDEVFSEGELNAYTQALNAALTAGVTAPAAVTGLRAEAGDGEVVLSWTALPAGATGYEVSMDGGSSWEAASSLTGHTFTGLDNGNEYTFKVRAVNVSMKGAEAAVTATPAGSSAAEKAAAPSFSVAAGTYTEAISVELSTATTGAVIHYTVDGSTPTEDSARYSGAIRVDRTMTIKAIAVKAGMEDSETAEAAYVISSKPEEKETAGKPVFSVKAGTYTEAKTVEISTSTEGAAIYYTTDGSMPTAGSTRYSKAITVDRTMTIKAIAVKEGMKDSEVATAAYTIKVNTPVDKPWIFTDVNEVPGNWKYESAKYVYNNDIMGAISGTTNFQPDRPLSRSMFATVLYRMAGEPKVAFENKFTDVPGGKWYSNAIIWAYKNKIVAGYMNGSFGIDDNITREQIAKMLFEYAKVSKYDISERKDLGSFTDKASVNGWAVEYMQWATAVKMITGKPNDDQKTYRMDPKGDATRAECAAMLTRFAEKYNK